MSTSFASVASTGLPHTSFPTGSRRDNRVGKGRFDLISPIVLNRDAKHLENGAAKYGDRNWEKGQPLMTYFDSAMRHLVRYQEGHRDEDHLAAARWNIACMIHTEEMVKRGVLPAELDDTVSYVEKPNPWLEKARTRIELSPCLGELPPERDECAVRFPSIFTRPAPKPRKVPGTDVIVPEQFKGKRVFYDPAESTTYPWAVCVDGRFLWFKGTEVLKEHYIASGHSAGALVEEFGPLVEVPL